ncbi:aspartyl protease family protein [Neolewinella antarctica]|uniref:Aspartyl protease n=1 Tax=Neolewinella antarctica TaxID=442734 RepID=A0ABX0XHR1_9BACT|nr:aspartyl protease family protein [Neolewinella antarctica]NJC28378.1 hypothetical protein [Neolewinella antarctica]
MYASFRLRTLANASFIPFLLYCSLLLTSATPLQASSQNSTVIPFTEVGGQLLIDAVVDGRTGKLILDTGAEGLVLNQKYFSGCARNHTNSKGLFGDVEAAQAWVRQLSVGGLELVPTRAAVVDLEHLARNHDFQLLGLLGHATLKAYAITLDYRNQVVVFSPANAFSPFAGQYADSFAFELENFIPVIEVTLAGRSLRMGLDTGAEYNLLDPRHADHATPYFKRERKVRVLSADGRSARIRGGKLYRVLLGQRHTCAAMGTLVVDLSHLEDIYGTELDGILGREFLGPWVFTIDYPRRMLYVHRFTPAPVPVPAVDRGIPWASFRTPF